MVSHKEIRVRQFIWSQFRSGKTEQETLESARSKFSADAVSAEMIDMWFARFKAGNNFILENDSVHAIQTLPTGEENDLTHSFVFASNDIHSDQMMVTSDGRLAVFYYKNSKKLVFYDLFHGESKEMPIASTFNYGYPSGMKMINYDHILMRAERGFAHLKIDYDAWNATAVLTDRRYVYDLIVDELNERRFFIDGWRDVSIGTLIENEFVTGPKQRFGVGDLKWRKLSGDRLIGFRNIRFGEDSWQFCRIDLNTLAEERVDVPSVSSNYNPTPIYCWAGDRLYVVFHDNQNQNQDRIFVFNSETRVWAETGISVYGHICEMFVDNENVLTLQAVKRGNKTTFHRFVLQKPDSLKNLSWLMVFRASHLFGGKIFEKIRHRLPFGKGIRCLFVSDYE